MWVLSCVPMTLRGPLWWHWTIIVWEWGCHVAGGRKPGGAPCSILVQEALARPEDHSVVEQELLVIMLALPHFEMCLPFSFLLPIPSLFSPSRTDVLHISIFSYLCIMSWILVCSLIHLQLFLSIRMIAIIGLFILLYLLLNFLSRDLVYIHFLTMS